MRRGDDDKGPRAVCVWAPTRREPRRDDRDRPLRMATAPLLFCEALA